MNEMSSLNIKRYQPSSENPVCEIERNHSLQGWCEVWQGLCSLRSHCRNGCIPSAIGCEIQGYSLRNSPYKQKPRNILFLDFDDVLNTASTLARGEMFEQENIEAFNAIVDRVDVDIVVTSVWRLGSTPKELEELLVNAGIKVDGRIIGTTPWLEDRSRGEEIMAWLKNAPVPVSRFAILDDRCDMEGCCVNLVRTDPRCGLLPTQAEEVVNLLSY